MGFQFLVTFDINLLQLPLHSLKFFVRRILFLPPIYRNHYFWGSQNCSIFCCSFLPVQSPSDVQVAECFLLCWVVQAELEAITTLPQGTWHLTPKS